MSCPGDEEILGYLEQLLSPEDRARHSAHFADCTSCQEMLADASRALADDGGAKSVDDAAGRYVLLATLGSGGMGIVQEAYDRQLDRKVALKFLSSNAIEDASRARARLQREAQTLARLNHPHVITVHDAGILDGEVFVAMELVKGGTLRQWLAMRPRSVGEVVAILRQAGEGLAAAHAAGLVHRDFKPENVLVGDDGRVRVTDFGLARPEGDVAPAMPKEEGLAPLASVTRTGVLAGTPAYMSPEQRAGDAADARSDLYSYCVTFHEAVTGVRPGAGDPKRRLPAWLDRAMARGLRASPGERWPSMAPLLSLLARGPTITPRRITALVALVALALGPALFIARQSHVALCAPDIAAFDGVWGATERDTVHTAFRKAYPTQADVAFGSVDAALERMKERWIAMRAESCSATRIRHDQSEALLDLRTACLDAHRRNVAALVRVFTEADRHAVENASVTAADVASLEACADARALAATEPRPTDPMRRAAVESAEAKLAEASALVGTGKDKEGLAAADAALVVAKRASYPPIEAKLLLTKATAMIEVDSTPAPILALLHEAANKAIEAKDDAAAASAWTLLAWQARDQGDEGRMWARYAASAIERLGGDDFLEADRATTLAVIELGRGHYDVARALLEKSRPLFVKTRGAEYGMIGRIDDALGSIAWSEQRFDEALRLHHQGRVLRERAFGHEHGAVVSSLFNEQGDLVSLGRTEEALPILREIEAIVAVLGQRPGYLDLSWAVAYRKKGDAAKALDYDRRALAGYEREFLPGNRIAADPLAGQGEDLLLLGRPAAAIAPLERALTLTADTDAPERGERLFDLARAVFESGGDRAKALALATQGEALLVPLAEHYGGGYADTLKTLRAWLGARR